MILNYKNYESKFKSNLLIFLIYFIWLIQLFFLFNYLQGLSIINDKGYALGGDSARYIVAAEQTLNGNLFNYPENVQMPTVAEGDTNNAYGYLGYVFFLSFFLFTKLGLIVAVFCQIIISGVAGFCLYKIGKNIWNKETGIISLFLFLFYSPLQQWCFYILTESLFINLGIIGFYFLTNRKNNVHLFFALIILLYTMSLRPFGVIIVPTLAFYFYMILRKNKNIYYYSYVSMIIVGLISLYPLINYYFEQHKIVNIFSKGDIIWNYYSLNPPYEISKYENNNDIYSLFYLIFNYPFYFLEVFIHKIFWFFSRYRPYYSNLNNLILIFFSLYFYFFSLLSIFTTSKNQIMKYTLLLYVFLTMLSVALTVADWDGRFSLPIIPIIILFCSNGTLILHKYFFRKFT